MKEVEENDDDAEAGRDPDRPEAPNTTRSKTAEGSRRRAGRDDDGDLFL